MAAEYIESVALVKPSCLILLKKIQPLIGGAITAVLERPRQAGSGRERVWKTVGFFSQAPQIQQHEQVNPGNEPRPFSAITAGGFRLLR